MHRLNNSSRSDKNNFFNLKISSQRKKIVLNLLTIDDVTILGGEIL